MARVLIIEDRLAIAMVLQEALADEGYQVDVATDGQQGMHRLLQDPVPDIVLVDLLMPGLSGREVIDSMREMEQTRETPVVLITGAEPNAEFPDVGRYQALIRKPFDLDQVVMTVRGLLP